MTTQQPRVALIAITKHGAAQVAGIAARLPEADVVVSEKFAETMRDLPNKVDPYSGALSAQIAPLFSRYDQIVFFCFTRCSSTPDRTPSKIKG